MKSLERQPKVKKALKDIISHLREVKGRQTAMLPMQDAPFQKKFQKTILGGFEDGVFARLIVPQTDWAQRLYAVCFYGYASHHVAAQMSYMATMEARVLFEGTELVFGLPIGIIEGHSLKEKEDTILRSSEEQLRRMIKDTGGFAVTHDSSRLLIVPTGFLLITASNGCVGARWSVSGGDSDTLRVKQGLQSVL